VSRGPRCSEQNDEDLFSYEDWDLWWQLAAAGFGAGGSHDPARSAGRSARLARSDPARRRSGVAMTIIFRNGAYSHPFWSYNNLIIPAPSPWRTR
jgi:hypothetical protein